MKAEVKNLGKSQLEVTFELDEQEFSGYAERALAHLQEHTKMDGFRQGQVPLDMVEKKVGQESLLIEAGDLAVKESYAKYVNENNLEPVGSPEVQILKIAKGSPMVFKVMFSVIPEIQLPDYKEIASKVKVNSIEVDEKEIEDALNYLQKSRAKFSQIDKGAELKDFVEIEYENENINQGKMVRDRFTIGEGGFMKDFENNILGMKAGEQKEFKAKFPENTPNNLAGKESNFKVKMISVQKMELPEINDEFAKSLGMFDTLVALKNNLKEGITLEKREAEKHKNRAEILANITEKIKFELPETMVEYEKSHSLKDLKKQVDQQFHIPLEEYLKQVNKTEEQIKEGFKAEAEKRIKNFLVLRQVGKLENIEVSNQEIEDEMNKVIRNYSKAEAQKIDISQLKEYTKSAIYNEKVFQVLEKLEKLSQN